MRPAREFQVYHILSYYPLFLRRWIFRVFLFPKLWQYRDRPASARRLFIVPRSEG